MAKQQGTTEKRANKQRRSRAEAPVVIGSVGELAEWAEWTQADAVGRSVEANAARLADKRLPGMQRRVVAAQIGEMQGNRHLQKTVAALKHVYKPETNQLNNGSTPLSQVTITFTRNTVIQRNRPDELVFSDEEVTSSPQGRRFAEIEARQARDSILKAVKEYGESIIQGHRQGYSNFKAWFLHFRSAEQLATNEILRGLANWLFDKALDIIFPEGTLFIRVLKSTMKYAWQQAPRVLTVDRNADTSEVDQFLANLEATEQNVITQQLDFTQEFQRQHGDVLENAKNELVFSWSDRSNRNRERSESELPASVKRILHSAGVGEPGPATATEYAERWLKAHITWVLSQETAIIQGSPSHRSISVMAEIAALRQLDQVGNRERIYALEQQLPFYFRNIANINSDNALKLGLLLHLNEEQAGRIVRARPFTDTEELVTRRLISRLDYQRIEHLVVVGH